MMKSIACIVATIAVLCLCNACSEVISPNVKEEKLVLNSPKDSLFTQQNKITFWWETNLKAENFHIQIASPNMDNPLNIWDTLTLGNTYIHTFEEGLYEWRIRIENNGSESEYQKRSFVIDNTPPLTPAAISPLDSTYLDASSKLVLTWESLDYPIQNVSFPTKDSVYLYRVLGTEWYPVAKKYFSFTDTKSWEISNYLQPNKQYIWEIKAYDKCGNGKLSDSFRFYTN